MAYAGSPRRASSPFYFFRFARMGMEGEACQKMPAPEKMGEEFISILGIDRESQGWRCCAFTRLPAPRQFWDVFVRVTCTRTHNKNIHTTPLLKCSRCAICLSGAIRCTALWTRNRILICFQPNICPPPNGVEVQRLHS